MVQDVILWAGRSNNTVNFRKDNNSNKPLSILFAIIRQVHMLGYLQQT